MSSTPLHDIWEASASQPFEASVSKSQQFNIAFTLILVGLICSGLFGLSAFIFLDMQYSYVTNANADNNLKSLPLYGIPASLAFG